LPVSVTSSYKQLTQQLQQLDLGLVVPETPPPSPPTGLRSLARARKVFLRAGLEDDASTVEDLVSIHFDGDVGERALSESLALSEFENEAQAWEYGMSCVERSRQQLEGDEDVGSPLKYHAIGEMLKRLRGRDEERREREVELRRIEAILASGAVGEEELKWLADLRKGDELLSQLEDEAMETPAQKAAREGRKAREIEEESRRSVAAIERSAIRVHGRVMREGCLDLTVEETECEKDC